MPITLKQAKVGMADRVLQLAIDEFRRGSILMDSLTFDNSISPGTGGSTLTYGYTYLKTPSTAEIREINKEYGSNEADKDVRYATPVILGGAFEVDRVIHDTSGQVAEATFQMEQKIKAAINYFHYLVINGDKATSAKEFDGLNKMLVGTNTEFNTSTPFNTTTMVTQSDAFKLLDLVDEMLSELDGKPSMLMGNSKIILRLQSAARLAGYMSETEDAFGRKVSGYNGIPFVDLGKYAQVNAGAVTTKDVVDTTAEGLTDLYAPVLGLDGFHGITPTGNNAGIRTYLPDFNTPGAVKKGEVEMVVGTVLKASRKAGVIRNLKVR